MKIVIVEDEIRIREGIIRLLNNSFPHISNIHEAKSAEEGISLIREIRPDIVISDIKMGTMDGLEMLSILFNQDKLHFKAIIVSAYSEFEYAKKAVSLGVKEFLVKPIDAEEFRTAIKHAEEELVKEETEQFGHSGTFGSLEHILYRILNGQLAFDDELDRHLQKTYAITPDTAMAQCCVYLGKDWNECNHHVSHILQTMMTKTLHSNDMLILVPERRLMLYVCIGDRDFPAFEKFLQDSVVKEINNLSAVKAAFAYGEHRGIENFRTCFETMLANIPWNIVFGRDMLISVSAIHTLKPAIPSYPIDIEQQSIVYLCAGDFKKLYEQGQAFIQFFSEEMCSPDMAKKYIIRYFLAVLQVVKEINFNAYEQINEQDILEQIAHAITAAELEDVLYGLFVIASRKYEIKTGLLVQKVLRMVDEYARDGITLEEVAGELEVSPDHISAQLVRELGVNFSTYIKTYRLIRAKELLIGTDLKLFEIAKQIGYQDAKYFGRVFKESEHSLPMEYRKKFR